MSISLDGKRVLITGGTRGIGRAIALAMAKAGAGVVVCGRTGGAAAETLAAELAEIGVKHAVTTADVTDPEAVTALIETCREQLGGLDVVVTSAGSISHVPYAKMDFEQWRAVMSSNLDGTHLVVQGSLPLLAEGSSIVLIGSAVASKGLPLRAHYTAAKSALVGYSRSLAKELGGKARVNVVEPGVIDTDQAAGLTPEQRARYEGMTALGRLGTPGDIADVVLFYASDHARYVTGTTLKVDGGM
ncbi:SDR family NAD(P)-dependent oxidoreductase [Amycolatopsis sp. NPDC059657]|uniref:SDR family NAD(P)-dependent oxidoreductase n=1 Tax=Amycolatopsis sp. NPDC059657 TaxID=3346899 RepID=UPI00366C5A86